MKVASRFLLPLEMMLACQALAWAVAGGIGQGGFHQVLEQRGENVVWMAVLGGLGLVQFAWAAWEWVCGRRWSILRMHSSVSLRAFLCFISIVVWVYALYTMIHFDLDRVVLVLTVTSPANLLFSGWCFLENLKVRYALDDRHSTSTLIFTR